MNVSRISAFGRRHTEKNWALTVVRLVLPSRFTFERDQRFAVGHPEPLDSGPWADLLPRKTAITLFSNSLAIYCLKSHLREREENTH